jgi:hypothetical protein
MLKKSDAKWLDLQLLANEIVHSDDKVDLIRYFTADVSPKAGDVDAPIRQSTYFRALRTLPNLVIHKGKFLPRVKHRPLQGQENTYVFVHDTEEKGSDVNLASFLLLDCFLDKFDVAVVMSQDTDLLEPLRMVRDEFGKEIVVTWFEASPQPGKAHKEAASRILHLSEAMLRRCQFSDPVIGRGGQKIARPDLWWPRAKD